MKSKLPVAEIIIIATHVIIVLSFVIIFTLLKIKNITVVTRDNGISIRVSCIVI